MILYVVRAVFVTIVAYIALSYAEEVYQEWEPIKVLTVALVGSIAVIALDLAFPRKSLFGLTGVLAGIVVGLVLTYAISLALDLLVESFYRSADLRLLSTVKLLVGASVCYGCVSVVLQTKDSVRFVIPYVEFTKQVKGTRPTLLDTSAIIDGRIADIAETNWLGSPLVVPRFVLLELQAIADSSDRLKRNRGRRGLDVLNRLQSSSDVDISIYDGEVPAEAANEGVDQKLVALASKLEGMVMTTDFNLSKVAQLRGVTVINPNELANALKPVMMAGEELRVQITRPGQEAGQGVGYLEDGTMVVVEGAKGQIGQTVDLMVTSVLQTNAGKMIFGRLEGSPEAPGRRQASQS